MRITDYPDLLRTKGKEPMPQAWDASKNDWTPALDSAATLKALREALGASTDATQADPVQEATAIALLKGLLELTANRATDQTLEQIKTAMTDGTQKVALTGNFDTLRTPAVGRRTVTATAAELFAGASRLASRRRLVIRNEDPVLRCLIGPATVSQQTGFPIEPGAVLEVPCDPEVAVPVYAISEGASLTVAVMEI